MVNFNGECCSYALGVLCEAWNIPSWVADVCESICMPWKTPLTTNRKRRQWASHAQRGALSEWGKPTKNGGNGLGGDR